MTAALIFRDVIRERLGADPGVIIGDGRIHRFSTKPSGKDVAGWYALHDEGVAVGVYGCWRSGVSETWSERERSTLSPAEQEAYRQRAASLCAAREEELTRARREAAARATAIWNQAVPVENDHPYLRAKLVNAHGIRQSRDSLVVPVRINGELSSLQFIDPDGAKKFLSGGAIAGGYHAIGKPDGVVVVCEGYATGVTIHEATGHAVAVAFTAGNLRTVAVALRAKLPTVRIVIAADDDVGTEGNPGLAAAQAACRPAAAVLAVPPFDRKQGGQGSDWNDFGRLRGSDAVRIAFEAVASAGVADPDKPSVGGIILKCAADVVSEPVDWLWRHYLARGKFHLLGGAPSAGKTTLACRLAATISSAGTFPGGSKAPVGSILIWSGEDAIADTLKPRLEAAGANLARIHFIDGVTEQDGPRAFDPARDIVNLERAVMELGDVALLVLDPVVSAVAGDGHKSNDVRRALQPLVDMVGRHGVAALGITHFSKGTSGRDPTERITGSVAFGALARVVLVAAKEVQDDGETATSNDTRIFTRAKSNIGPDGGGFRYAVEQVDLPGGITTTRVVWGEPLSGSARELLGQAESETEQGGGSGAALDEAVNFLLFELADGAVPVKELERSAANAGIARATLRRAYEKAGVKKDRSGFGKGGSWIAFIPGSEPIGAHETPKVLTPDRMSTNGQSEHLWTNGAEIEL